MTRKLLVVLVFFFLITFVSAVNAQTASTGSAQTTISPAEKLEQQMQLINQQRQLTTFQIKVDLKQQIKDTVQARREELKDTIASKEAEFKAKLQTIKDLKKKAIVEDIDTKLGSINTKHTDRFMVVLGNLQTILDKIGADVNKTEANAAINAAKVAVEDQATMTYSLAVTTEGALRVNIGATVSQFRQDMVATYKAVVNAKQAVQKLNVIKPAIEKKASGSADL